MDRREAIKRTSVLLGGALSAPVIAGILKGCKPAGEVIDWQPAFFTEAQAKAISVISEIFIPKTDTPGAKEVGVPAFIDTMVSETYDKEYQTQMGDGLEQFLQGIIAEKEKPFDELEPPERIEIIRELNATAVSNLPLPPPDERPFILLVKELVLLGFCISEAGATQVLQYDPVPGVYTGCVPYEEVGGKQWVSSGIR